MSRSVAGFVLLFYVCAVSGQQYPRIRLKGTGDEPSIVIDHISGGHYPDGAFSIGHGTNSVNGDGGPGADIGENGLVYPNQGDEQGQNEGGFINGQNDVGGHGGRNGNYGQAGYNHPPTGSNEYGTYENNNVHKPANPYEDQHNQQNVPTRNSASRIIFYPSFWNRIFSWF